MKNYHVTVTEVVATKRTYTIEAKNRKEALAKAAIGDTIAEYTDEGSEEVIARTILSD